MFPTDKPRGYAFIEYEHTKDMKEAYKHSQTHTKTCKHSQKPFPSLSFMTADKPRGYAFIEYEHKKDMKEAYKQADGRKIEGRRILVDVERGRTVDNW
jgi:U1 small nuclear ribonucleoprotein